MIMYMDWQHIVDLNFNLYCIFCWLYFQTCFIFSIRNNAWVFKIIGMEKDDYTLFFSSYAFFCIFDHQIYQFKQIQHIWLHKSVSMENNNVITIFPIKIVISILKIHYAFLKVQCLLFIYREEMQYNIYLFIFEC